MIKKKFFSDLKNNIVYKLGDIYRKKKNLPDHEDVDVYVKDIKKMYYLSVTYNFYKLIKTMWQDGNSVISPNTFKECIGQHEKMFMGFRQHDSQEFVNFVLDNIHEELKVDCDVTFKNVPDPINDYIKERHKFSSEIKKVSGDESASHSHLDKLIENFDEFTEKFKKEELMFKYLKFWQTYMKSNYSIIQDLFGGLYLNEITCSECNYKSHRFDPFTSLTLDLPSESENNNIGLNDCLKNFTKPEILTDDNKYFCEKCKKKVDANKTMYLWEIPDYFIVQLKRFKNIGMRTMKNEIKVNIPFEDINFENNEHEYHSKKNDYELYGVIRQFGSLNGGHYVAITKNVMNNKWYEFNDSSVVHLPDDQVKKILNDSSNYILFYRKKNLNIMKNMDKLEEDSEESEDSDDNNESDLEQEKKDLTNNKGIINDTL